MTEQEEFEEWKATLIDEYDDMGLAKPIGAWRGWQACAERKDAKIDKLSQIIKDLKLLTGESK